MGFSDALKPCMEKSFFGSVLSAGATLVTGHFALIPITAKFVTNFTFCLKDYDSEKTWNKAKKKLYEIEIKDQTIEDFRDDILSTNYHQLSINKNSVLNDVLNSSSNILKYSINDWDSNNFKNIVNYCLKQTGEIDITRKDYSILEKILSNNYDFLINSILSEFFVEAAFNCLPYMSNVIETPQQILENISRLPNLQNPKKAAKVVEFLFINREKTITYKYLQGIISYEYSNDLLNRLNGYVVKINKRTRPHWIYIRPYVERTFYKEAFRGLKRHYVFR